MIFFRHEIIPYTKVDNILIFGMLKVFNFFFLNLVFDPTFLKIFFYII